MDISSPCLHLPCPECVGHCTGTLQSRTDISGRAPSPLHRTVDQHIERAQWRLSSLLYWGCRSWRPPSPPLQGSPDPSDWGASPPPPCPRYAPRRRRWPGKRCSVECRETSGCPTPSNKSLLKPCHVYSLKLARSRAGNIDIGARNVIRNCLHPVPLEIWVETEQTPSNSVPGYLCPSCE